MNQSNIAFFHSRTFEACMQRFEFQRRKIEFIALHTHLFNAPPTLRKLSIQHCPQIHASTLLSTLSSIGPQLTHITIRHPMNQLYQSALDTILQTCPKLLALRISADYISNLLFCEIPPNHPLQILDLECSTTAGAEIELSPNKIYDAVEECLLPDLRSVRASARLAWTATKTKRQDCADLLELLEENDMERPLGVEVGVWWNIPDS